MIEIFFLFFCSCRVSYADRVPQIIPEDLLNFFRIFFQKCIAEFFQFFTVIPGHIAEPFPDFLYKKVFNFPVWNSQAVFSAFCTSLMRQISGSKKYAPQIFNAFIKLIICEFQRDFFFNAFSCNQTLDFVFGLDIRFVYKSAHRLLQYFLWEYAGILLKRQTADYHWSLKPFRKVP